MESSLFALLLTLLGGGAPAPAAQWPAPKAPVIPAADGYVVIPNAAVPPDPAHSYRAIFDATKAARDPKELAPALNMAGSELNAFGVAGVRPSHVHFAVVFHGAALDALLDDSHYKAKFGVTNPNLPVLEQFRKAGVELFVCGQNLAFEHIDPATLSPSVAVASDALIVLIAYQNRGYALLSF
ncbi:MAG TPA: DsrE family protein [Thermoanaerobaculia bacterium]|jgi:intracellular sulfur oxidation DsrE/DsrF family protein